MSIKDLFGNKGVPKIQKGVTSDELVLNVESSDFVESKRKQFSEFIPPIDFSSASNFAKFGSAELYYEKAFERIHNSYPYDGTLAEKIEYENSSSYLDKYVFNNLYPRTNGYLSFSGNEYITIFGGPHTASSGMDGKKLSSTFDLSMKYDEEKKRTSAFEYRGDDGCTIEFWLKKDGSVLNKETIFEAKNNDQGSITLFLQSPSNKNLRLALSSSTTHIEETVMTDAITDNEWNHYAVSFATSDTGTILKSYKNGQEQQQITLSSTVSDILPTTSGMNATIASASSEIVGTTNNLSASLDEFRFWKTERTSEQIFNNWFIPFGGGTNRYDANIDLGAYFKFNEGITTNESLDAIVLDYSGRINNGDIINYSSSMRSTGSAITEKLGQDEFLDPIIYSSHPDVVAKKSEYKTSGSLADLENSSMLLGYFPGWMQEEDAQNGKKLKNLSQLMGSYFDTVWHQIDFINKVHNESYVSGSNKALPFAKNLLYNKGFVIPDLFVDSTIIETFRKKDENEVYEKEINEVKNLIYQNIYNNLNSIYQSKGTEKSFRNFFRTMGIGQDVIKLNLYADDSTYVINDNYENKSVEKKFLDFSKQDDYSSTIFQTSSLNNSEIYTRGDKNNTGSFTLETEVILPKKQGIDDPLFRPYGYLTSSILGYQSTGSTGYDEPSNDLGFHIFLEKETLEANLRVSDKQRVRFVVSGSNTTLRTEWQPNQYENNKWTLSLRLKHSSYPRPNITGSNPDDYLLEFYGVETDGNIKRNYFHLTQSALQKSIYSSDKIFYAGAYRENLTGSSITRYSDIKLGHVRYWHSFLSNEAIDNHAYDPNSFGADRPHENDLVESYTIDFPREKSLNFHWAFNDITSSNSSGELFISDFSSGSTSAVVGNLSPSILKYIGAKGIGFDSSSVVVDKMYINSYVKRQPDDLYSSNSIVIKTDETENFFVDDDVSDNFYSFEKSMWGVVSNEMLKMFGTIVDFNSIIGRPNQKYHNLYHDLKFLSNKFFEDVENEPDFEKFTEFYKWIDDSISIAMSQLIPASSRFSSKINNIIESHMLERSKYVHQIPILTDFQSTEGSIKGISEMTYNWRFGHALVDNTSDESSNTLWHSIRSEKDGLREILKNSKNKNSLQSSGLIRKEIDGSTRVANTFSSRRFSKTYDISIASEETIHGGTNFSRKKNLNLFHESIAPAGALGTSLTVPQNVITVGVGAGTSGLVEKTTGQYDKDAPPRKREVEVDALIGNRADNEYGHNILGSFVLPMNVMSGTVRSGFNSVVDNLFVNDLYFSNLHNDTVGNNNERSIQGPFTEQHVGGLQYRHVDIATDPSSLRPEGWALLIREHPVSDTTDSAFGFVGADYEAPYPSETLEKATRYRDEHAKRPINVRNIKTVSGSQKVGNYKNDLEIFQVSPTHQKTWAIEAYDDPNYRILPEWYDDNMPDSTHYQSLLGVAPFLSGNVFGIENNNRQPSTSSVVIGSADNYSYTTASFVVQANNGVDRTGHELQSTRNSVTTDFEIGGTTAGNTVGINYGNKSDYNNYSELKTAIENKYTGVTATFNIDQISLYYLGLEFDSNESANNTKLTASYSSGFGQNTTDGFCFGSQLYWESDANSSDYNYLFNAGSRKIYFRDGKLYCEFNYADARGDEYSDTRFLDTTSYTGTSVNIFVQTIGTANTLNTSNAVKYYVDGTLVPTSTIIGSEELNQLVRDNSGLGGTPSGSLRYLDSGNTIELFQNYARRGIAWADEVVIYHSAISPSSTMANIVNNMPTPTVATTQLVSHLRFAGTTWSTEQGSISNVTLTNGTVFPNNPLGASGDYELNRITGATVKKMYNPVDSAGWLHTSGSATFTLTLEDTSTNQNITLAENGSTFSDLEDTTSTFNTVPINSFANVNVKEIPRTDLTGSERNILTRFSAPGGPEIQSIGYLDAFTTTYSVYNALPFRNLSVLGSGSGEEGTIRVEDHLGKRRGLKTLRALHMGKFGIDSQYGSVTADYPSSGSFNKQHRNTSQRMEYSGSSIITGSNYDNAFINTSIPRSEFQYSWIQAATSGSHWYSEDDAPSQRILGYAPRDGIVSSSVGYVEAIVFPSASSIYGS